MEYISGEKNIKASAKFQLFQAVTRSIHCYASQVWGYSNFEEVNKLQRYFVKKLFKFPDFTPNYALNLETGLPDMCLYTLKMHMDYVTKVLFRYPANRLPAILSRKIIDNDCSWFSEWKKLGESLGISWSSNVSINEESWKSKVIKTIESLRERQLQEDTLKANNSSHGIYRLLDYTKGYSYFTNDYSNQEIAWIFKMRAGLMGLNASKTREGSRRICSLCSMREEETITHFLGKCPSLKEFRYRIFNKRLLEEDQVTKILNCNYEGGWKSVYNFAKSAWLYRKQLVQEYNT